MAPGPDVVMGQRSSSSSGAAAGSGGVPASGGTRRTADSADLPRLQDLAESRPVQSAHGEMLRLGELSGETSEVAEVFCPRRRAGSCSLFDMLPEVVLDLRTVRNLNDLAGRAKCWATLEERNPVVVIGSLPQLSELRPPLLWADVTISLPSSSLWTVLPSRLLFLGSADSTPLPFGGGAVLSSLSPSGW